MAYQALFLAFLLLPLVTGVSRDSCHVRISSLVTGAITVARADSFGEFRTPDAIKFSLGLIVVEFSRNATSILLGNARVESRVAVEYCFLDFVVNLTTTRLF
jgi:hypothetical protein